MFMNIDFFQIAAVFLISFFSFIGLIVCISKYPQKTIKLLKIIFVIIFVVGMSAYFYFHYRELELVISGQLEIKALNWAKNENENNALTPFYILYIVMSSVMDVGMMFYGRGNSDVFYNLPESKNPIVVSIFWIFSVLAFYTAASALLIRFGNDLLRWIRIIVSKNSDILLIFGINPDSLAFGRNVADVNANVIVYVDDSQNEAYESSIRDLGGLAYTDRDAVKANSAFLKKIYVKPRKTKLKLYALSKDYDKNLHYSRMLLESLKNSDISPEQTALILLGTDELKGMNFQAEGIKYGYGNVVSFDEFELCSRFLITKYPLCNAISFDKNARASEDIHALIVGFGRVGHEVLRKLIANGQFEGSKFYATVYDPNFENRAGFIKSQYPNMFANYNIDFEPQGGRSSKFFKFLEDNASKLNYIVICIEDREISRDIAIRMVDRLQNLGYSQNVYTCDTKSVRCYSQNASECDTHWIYDSELLHSDTLDKYAMELNHRYAGGSDVYEDWKQCGYFDRMSSRACVDYLIPLIQKINKNSLTRTQRENLAKSEHLRWCAFHYTFGFDVMDKEDFVKRVRFRQNEIIRQGKSSIKITKDMDNLRHVCLVDWKELDEISRLENAVTHGNKNYKDFDRNNVDMIMSLIKIKKDEKRDL